MNNKKIINSTTVVATLLGLCIGIGIMLVFKGGAPGSDAPSQKDKEPLYWVAPMDANYRRDKPGKSPMGMDLIPVYENDGGAADDNPGSIRIAPNVVNNLGVRTALVERKSLHSEIITVGYVHYDEDKLIHIHPRISGWVEKLYVKTEGDPVTKGTPLYSLYSPELVNAQEELVLAINRHNSRLIQAAEDRLQALQIPQNFIAQLKRTLTAQQTVTFYAPQSGVVDNLNIREGFFVQPGTTMLSIGALDPVWVEAEIFERQAALVKTGDPVTMTLDYLPGKTWNGQVNYIYPTLDSETRTVRLRLTFNNPNRLLKPNMFAQVTVHTDTEEQTTVIPREALIRTGSQDRVVLALGDGRFKSVAVKVGRQDQSNIEILEGLAEGEEVVSSAQFLLDSESSKTSDFKRMSQTQEKPTAVWVAGEIQAAMPTDNMVSATHEPIAEWDWPAMTMDFKVNSEVDIGALTPGTQLHMQISKLENGDYEITGTHIMAQAEAESKPQSAQVEGLVNRLNVQDRTANISRGAIEKWGRPAATLDFLIADDVAIEQFAEGKTLQFEFEIRDGDFVVTEVLEPHMLETLEAEKKPGSKGAEE